MNYVVTGLFQDLDGLLGETNISTSSSEASFWTLYNELTRVITDQLGGGIDIVLGIFLHPPEVEIIHKRYEDPGWANTLWPTDYSTPFIHPYHVVNPGNTIGTIEGGNILNILPHVRVLETEDTPECIQVYMWFSNCHQILAPPLLIDVPSIWNVSMIITCGDSGTLHRTNFAIEERWKYRDFIYSLINYLGTVPDWAYIIAPIIQRGCITMNDFVLFMLPRETPENEQFINLLLFLCDGGKGYKALTSTLIRLPWEGPLCHVNWAQITLGLYEGDFKLLIVTGQDRMNLWQRSEAYTQLVRVITMDRSPEGMIGFGSTLLMKILSIHVHRRYLMWQPTSIFYPKVYGIQVNTAHHTVVNRFYAEISQIIGNRAATAMRLRECQLIAMIPDLSGVYPRLAIYEQRVCSAGIPFIDMYNLLLQENPIFGDGMYFGGMFISSEEMDELLILVNGITPPEDPSWMYNAQRRFSEIHRFLHLNNDDIIFDKLTEYLYDRRCLRVLMMTLSSAFPAYAQRQDRHRDIIIHVIDGTFSTAPVCIFSVDEQWEYTTFLTELLRFLSGSYPSFKGLLEELLEASRVGRGAVRLFLVPQGFSASLQFACGLLCDIEGIAEQYFSQIFPEITWDGCARIFPLNTVLPPGDFYDLLIIIDQKHRRSWLPFFQDPDNGLFSLESAQFLVNELYKGIMPWFAPLYRGEPQLFVHVRRTTYFNGSSYSIDLNHETALSARLHECALALYAHANDAIKELMLEFDQVWGSYFNP
jgi:hypothetical protein